MLLKWQVHRSRVCCFMPNLFYGVIYFWYLRGHCSFATLTNVIYVRFKRLLHLNVFRSSFLLCTLFQCNQCSLFSAAQAAAQTQFAFYSKINTRINGCQRKQTVRNTERSKAFFPHCIDFMSISLPTCIYCFYLISERLTCFVQWIFYVIIILIPIHCCVSPKIQKKGVGGQKTK